MQNETEILKRLTDVEARLAAIDGKTSIMSAPKPAPIEEGVRITQLPPQSTAVEPSPAELKQLFSLSFVRLKELGKAPVFSGPSAELDKEKYFQGFCNSFFALGFISRADSLDKKHSASFWLGRANDVLRERGTPRELDGFLAAVIAWGVPYNDSRLFPFVQEYGLVDYGMGRPATDAWRKVPAAGRAPEPTAIKAPGNLHSPSFVRAAG
jgi:hypothetical protein